MSRNARIFLSLILSFLMIVMVGCRSNNPIDSSSNLESSAISSIVINNDVDSDISDIVSSDEVTSNVSSDLTSSNVTTSSNVPTSSDVTTSSDASQVASDKYDKPESYQYAYMLEPLKSTVDNEANAMRNSILNSKCANPPSTGQKWYISSKNGSDNNDGKTPQTAFATTKPLRFAAGDSILFECGGVYRDVSISVLGNMFIGSYGTGDKPCLYGSIENSANSVWNNQGGNIWKLSTVYNTADVGNIVFNHGEKVGTKQFSMSGLTKELDFYFEKGFVYLYCSKNPSEMFNSIDVCPKTNIIMINEGVYNVTIDNLTIKYAGYCGILGSGDTKGITIRNCEVAWIGGVIYSETARYGNGIGFWNGCQDTLIENCWVYECYDSGISPQGDAAHVEKNITIRNNLIEYCGYASYEYWVHPATRASIENMLVTGNIMRFSSCGFGTQGRDFAAPHILSNGRLDNLATNFVISNNIFEYSKGGGLAVCESNVGTLPEFVGNRYIQSAKYYVGTYTKGNGSLLAVRDKNNGQKIITQIFKDTTGVFELYPY